MAFNNRDNKTALKVRKCYITAHYIDYNAQYCEFGYVWKSVYEWQNERIRLTILILLISYY